MLRGPSTPACRRNEIRTARPAREASGSPVRNRYLLPSSRPKGQLRPKSVSSALSTAECPEIRRMPVPPQPPPSTRRPATPPTKVAQSHSATPEPHPSAERIAQAAMWATHIDPDSVRGTLTTHDQPTPPGMHPMPHWVHPTHRTPHWVHPTHPMPHWGASPHPIQPAPMHPTSEAPSPSPAPRYEAPLRSGGACQGIFPALTSTPRPSAQSSFGVPHARSGQCRRQATSRPRPAHENNSPHPSRTPSNIHPRYHPIWGIPPPVDLGNRPKRS